jgi:hypothetical protein
MKPHSGILSFGRVFLCLALLLATGLCVAQTATTGAISGTITDPSGAVVPGAQVVLTNKGTNAAVTQTTNSSGQYVFPNIAPGTYALTVKKDGFRNETIDNISADVDKTTNLPVALQVGSQTQTVEVSATGTVQLQTSDAQIGNTVSTKAILQLPTLNRNAISLMGLQPAAVGGSNLAIRSAGAVDDQNIVTLDGLDITQQVVAGNTAVPTPADSVQEFNETVITPNADLTRASGAQVSLIGRRGSNRFDGALYEYLQNSNLNTNTWDNNRSGVKKAPIRDNRFGGRIGGPIQKDKTFFFFNYEGRRFAQVAQVTRTVPTDSLKAGIITLKDASGVTETFNLATAKVCGAAGNGLCDPRGLGISPAVKAQWALMPEPNQFGSVGDGLNTAGYFFNLPAPIQTNYGVARLDHVFSDTFRMHADYTYFLSITTGSGDVGIVNGNPQSFVQTPQRGSVYSISADWQIKPTWLNVFRFGYVRDNNANQATSPTAAAGILNIPGSNTSAGPIGLLIGSGVSSFLDSPIDMDTQRARYQANYNGDLQWQDNMTKIWGKHTFQFGVQVNMLPYTHVRADKVVGSIASLVATVDGNQGYVTIPTANTPPTCSSSITSGCITTANATNWARFYASTLGIVDNVNVLAVRNAQLQPLPFGTFLQDHTNEWAPYFYGQDTWRLSRTLTLTLGLSYGWQSAPTEKNNLQTVMIDATNGNEISAPNFLQQRLSAALAGQNYNPQVGFATVGALGKPVFNPDYGDWAPRASFAWSPTSSTPLIGKLVGDQKTVLRGGFSIVYDRSNTVQSVEIPMLGVGFDQTIIAQAPLCNSTGVGGAGCSASSGSANPGLSSFRVGVDGSLPLPVPSAVTSPVIPPGGFTETLSFQVDPTTHVGRSYNVDLGIQRELPGKIRVEAAFIGRFSRHLPQAVDLNQVPYMMVDPTSSQSFAQAYDALANGLRSGSIVASNLSTIPAQPFFENQFPGLAKLEGTASATAYIVSKNSAAFSNGNLGNLFTSGANNLAALRRAIGLNPLANDQAQVEFMRTYIGESNYSGAIFTMQKSTRNLTMVANFTYSHYLDDYISNQNNAGFYANSFHPGVDYGPDAGYDRHRVFNGYYIYQMPFGKGQRFSTSNAVLNKIIGGWYTSGIVTLQSGLPLTVTESSQAWGGATATIGVNSAMIPTGPVPSANQNVQTSSCTVAGTGTVGNTALTGSGLDIFANPCAVYSSFRFINISSDTRTGRANPMRGFALYDFDASFGKDTKITERFTLRFTADMFNILNFHNYSTPGLSFTSPTSFGVISSTNTPANLNNSARWIQFGLRVEF